MSVTRRIMTAFVLSAGFALAACGGNGDQSAGEGQSRYERAGDRGLGSPDAAVTMIEYASVSCPACATFHEQVWPTLESDYIEPGKVRFVFREMITGSPQFAIAGFALAHCVADDRYFDVIDLLFQQQRAIFQAAQTQGSARGQYLAIARSVGLSEEEFSACLNNEEVNRAIVASHDQALEDGIDGTPRFLFNGDLLEARRAPGASDYTYFLGGRQMMVAGEPVPARVDAATFRLILDHLVEQAGDADSDETDG